MVLLTQTVHNYAPVFAVVQNELRPGDAQEQKGQRNTILQEAVLNYR